jgi:DNA polymerase-1
MRHATFGCQTGKHSIALLIKESAFHKQEIQKAYIDPLISMGVDPNEIIAFTLDYNSSGKAPVKHIKGYLASLIPSLSALGVETIYCADAAYFKELTAQKKAEPHLGYVLPCSIPEFKDVSVVLGVNHTSLLYNPGNEAKLDMSLKTLGDFVNKEYTELGSKVIEYSGYPKTYTEIEDALNELLDKPRLAVDIEGFSLRFNKAGVGTIAFAWSENEGIAFKCDFTTLGVKSEDARYGEFIPNPSVRQLLKNFFEAFQGELIFHNAPYDTKCLIYSLWMKDLVDNEGLLKGLEYMYRNTHDTKVIAYLSLNSTSKPSYSLKDLAHEFAGNWAQDDIKDIRKIPETQLLEYNLVDTLCTFYVFNKYYPIMVEEEQEFLYKNEFMPYQMDITQIELTGMPIDMAKVREAKAELTKIVNENMTIVQSLQATEDAQEIIRLRKWEKDFQDRKAKAKNPDKIFPKDKATYTIPPFNPGSGDQLAVLLFEVMDLPILDKTKTGLPATGGDIIEKLINHTEDAAYKECLAALIELGKAQKILSAFIPAFEQAILKPDGHFYLHGSFNLGGTVSGRLSSSDPNLQNLPSGSRFAKLIKACFVAPKGWIFCGADFNSLEDYVSALTTKDPNKLKVYLDGYDGHCLRAYSYFKDQMPDITDDVEGINSIETKYPKLRQKSKTPTFALTYQGTWNTLVRNLGMSKDEAQAIETNYHELYKVSDEWVQARLRQAESDGYVTTAFGLRVRTPLLHKTLGGRSTTPYEAAAEGRTAGNALGQGYGLLTNRSMKATLRRVRNSVFRNLIKPVAMIHDANYFLVKDNLAAVKFLNDTLIEEMEWQELPEIQHDKVKLGAALDLFYPNWGTPITLPVGASNEDILNVCRSKQAA